MAEIVRPTHSITPELTVKDAAGAIDFYKKAFGAEEVSRMNIPGGDRIVHAEVKIGDTLVFLSDEFPEMGGRSPQTLGGTTASLYLLVDDVDLVFKRAIEAGGKEEMAVEDMFWGDRMGSLIDPAGHHWAIATHKEDIEPDELRKRAEVFFAQMDACKETEAKASI